VTYAASSRTGRYAETATALALLSDRQLEEALRGAVPLGVGIGGTTALLRVAGVPVFVKWLVLTDLERRPEHVRSTANMFRLPTFCHYGVGSVGAGAWRELAAHEMTTNWVLSGQSAAFPLMYHWRVLAGPPKRPPTVEETVEEQAETDRMVAYWAGSAAVRGRLDALALASWSVVLFLEYLPQNLDDWLTAQAAQGAGALGSACAMVERCLRGGIAFLNGQGLWHFDAHFGNILTDGERLYFTDFGLASSSRFALSGTEVEFLERHRTHDGCYVATQLVNWLVTALSGAPDRDEFIRGCAAGDDPAIVPPEAASIIARYAPIAVVMNAFYRTLYLRSRTAPYPAHDLERVCATIGFWPNAPSDEGNRMMDIQQLAAEHVSRFNDSVAAGDFSTFTDAFADDATMTFTSPPLGTFVGRAAIAEAYRLNPPSDTIVLVAVSPSGADAAGLRYAWSADPTQTADMSLSWHPDGRVRSLEIALP